MDRGTKCLATMPAPRPVGAAPSEAPVPVVTFRQLWASYPSHSPYVDARGKVPEGFENQCAIKVSAALLGAGQPLTGFRGATVLVDSQKHAIRAEELAGWLRTTAPAYLRRGHRLVTGSDWQEKAKGLTGIIAFKDYWLREGEKHPSGDHIDLWNGSRLTASGLEGLVVTALRFGLGISSGPGFSDLGKARRIELWVVE